MDTLQAIMNRRSIREYKRASIPWDEMQQILEAVRQAPSAANRQPVHFVIVSDPAQKQKVADACNSQMWMADASYIIVAVGQPQVSSRWYKVDVAIALENLALAACSLGYGTCWVGAFDPEKVRMACGLPAEMEVVVCMPLGVPDVDPAARPRKEWGELFSANRYGESFTA